MKTHQVEMLLDLLKRKGFVRELGPFEDHRFFRLGAGSMIWRLGDGTPLPVDLVWSRRGMEARVLVNRFFQ